MDNKEHKNEYFINRNIFKSGVTTDDGEYSRTGKALWILVPLIIAFIVVAAVIMLTKSFLAGIPAILASGTAYVYILRKFVFDENQFKRLVANNEMNKEITMGHFSNLLTITEDQQLFFQINKNGLGSSFIVTFDYASLFDETENADENAIRNAFVPFFKKIHEYGFGHINIYDVSLKNQVSPGTLDLIRRTRMLTKGSWLQLVMMLQNETVSNLEQNGSSKYRVFFEIENSNYKNVVNFKSLVEDAIKSTLSTQTSVVSPHIVDDEELINFMINYFNIENFPINNLEINIKSMTVDKYFNFVDFFDINGIEYNIDAFDPQFNSSKSGTIDLQRNARTIVGKEVQSRKNEKDKAAKAESVKQRQSEVKRQRNERMFTKKTGIKRPNDKTSKVSKQKAQIAEYNRNKEATQKEQQEKLRRAKRDKERGGSVLTLNDLLNSYDDKND